MERLFLSVHLHGPICFHSLSRCISYLLISLKQRSTINAPREFTSLPLCWYKKGIQPILPGVVYFLHSSLCSALVYIPGTAVLVSHQCFDCRWTVLTHHRGCPSSSSPPKAGRLGLYLYLWSTCVDVLMRLPWYWCGEFLLLMQVCDAFLF